ncbi:TM2 domain-containing protein [Arthrobacter jiangjiafuii]|uniref:TM2 domain-containing protein n=1 Tax=Arthrobacter jiangjiafuii TaxID=2817475 RepID=UPI002353A138|nr:TM2 domain-containing protein [Arthrobacter jiangjiafuii]
MSENTPGPVQGEGQQPAFGANGTEDQNTATAPAGTRPAAAPAPQALNLAKEGSDPAERRESSPAPAEQGSSVYPPPPGQQGDPQPGVQGQPGEQYYPGTQGQPGQQPGAPYYAGQGYPQQGAPGAQYYPGTQGQPGQPYPGQGYPQAGYGQAPYAQGPYGQGHPVQKSRLVAGLLGIFLGGLGIHRFYLGHTALGITQLVLTVVLGIFTLGLVGLWGFIEGIMILCNAQVFRTDARGIPLRD